jgi:hypothetical protein
MTWRRMSARLSSRRQSDRRVPRGPLLGRSSFAGIDQALQRYLAWRQSRPEYDNVIVVLHFVADRYRSDRTIGIANHPYRRDLAPLRSQLSFKISGR